MPPSPSAELIAHFLRANDYTETLDAFIREAGLPADIGVKSPISLDAILDEKRAFDLASRFERLGTSDQEKGWTDGAPTTAHLLSLPSPSNVLHVSLNQSSLFATTPDSRIATFDLPSLEDPGWSTHDSPILSVATHGSSLLLSGMAGQLILSHDGKVLSTRRDHSKYVVAIASAGPWLATAAWDGKVHLYHLPSPSLDSLPGPTATITLPTNPEALLFVPHPDSGNLILIITRRDSTFLYYYTLSATPRLLGRQNLTPHSNAWVAFTPSAIALSPIDKSLVAVATSTVPHMKLLIVRLLIPPEDTPTIVPTPNLSALDTGSETPAAAQARVALALQDREDAAIQVQCSTLAPQTQYSTPALAWRPDGTGVWVNADDGAVRGFEARTGRHVATLRGHEAGTKIRCVAAGTVGGEEWLVTGGFDRRLIVWKA